MIVRIVQMTFRAECIEAFTTFFEGRKQTIRNFPGCSHLELWQDSKNPVVFFTYSNWNSETDLDHYRFSDFFKDTWRQTKEMFADKPQAWSVNVRSNT